MYMTLYKAECIGDVLNKNYPNEETISNPEELREVVKHDTVAVCYKDFHRKIENFISSNVIIMDCDNDHSDNPNDWITPEKMSELLGNVAYAITPSRHNNTVKNDKSPRPRFHLYFPVNTITDPKMYAEIKKMIYSKYPFLDKNALDAARFMFGADAGPAIWHEGDKTIMDILTPLNIPTTPEASNHITATALMSFEGNIPAAPVSSDYIIPEGSRNSTLSLYAAKKLKRYGNTDLAYSLFLDEAKKCSPPLDKKELETIWRSAVGFASKVASQPDYIPPEEYNHTTCNAQLRPCDYSDIGQAKALAGVYKEKLIYTEGNGFFLYNGHIWSSSDQNAVSVMEEFLDRQLIDATNAVEQARSALIQSGVSENVLNSKNKTLLANSIIGDNQKQLLAAYYDATTYLNFINKHRDVKYINSALLAAKPMLHIKDTELDSNPFLLNTPNGTYDLGKGMAGYKAPDCLDYITKQTLNSASEKGKELWLNALQLFFCNDRTLIEYVQQIVGLAAIGKVFNEAIIIAYGGGKNGKSTFWNSIAKVLGSYSGCISADVLTAGCRRNIKPELAELHGKRLIIAAELEEGVRLNTSMLKQLVSTDKIKGEKKFKSPFDFEPSHTVVLYTNHLPRVGASDDGTWRRLIVIPFNARIDGGSDIKNYADYLVQNAGEYILQWIIEGAQKIIAADYHLSTPAVVTDAIAVYHANNDWLNIFLEECCDLGDNRSQKSGRLYEAYREYCKQTGEYARSTTDFYTALEAAGYSRKVTSKGKFILGLSLKDREDHIT